MKTLGILITSDRYPQYIVPMVRAAHARGLAVHLHLTGCGVRLIQSIDLDTLTELARITICRDSAASHRMTDRLAGRYARLLTRADEMVRLIHGCDRHVVL